MLEQRGLRLWERVFHEWKQVLPFPPSNSSVMHIDFSARPERTELQVVDGHGRVWLLNQWHNRWEEVDGPEVPDAG